MGLLERPIGAGVAALADELATYEQLKPQLIAEAEGKYVLIKGTKLAGVYPSAGEAIAAGYQRFGNVPFLVQQILPVEATERLASGLISL